MLKIIPEFCRVMVDPQRYKPSKTSKVRLKNVALREVNAKTLKAATAGDASERCDKVAGTRQFIGKIIHKYRKRDRSVCPNFPGDISLV